MEPMQLLYALIAFALTQITFASYYHVNEDLLDDFYTHRSKRAKTTPCTPKSKGNTATARTNFDIDPYYDKTSDFTVKLHPDPDVKFAYVFHKKRDYNMRTEGRQIDSLVTLREATLKAMDRAIFMLLENFPKDSKNLNKFNKLIKSTNSAFGTNYAYNRKLNTGEPLQLKKIDIFEPTGKFCNVKIFKDGYATLETAPVEWSANLGTERITIALDNPRDSYRTDQNGPQHPHLNCDLSFINDGGSQEKILLHIMLDDFHEVATFQNRDLGDLQKLKDQQDAHSEKPLDILKWNIDELSSFAIETDTNLKHALTTYTKNKRYWDGKNKEMYPKSKKS